MGKHVARGSVAINNDSNIESRLGKLPRKLATLYLEIYNAFFANT